MRSLSQHACDHVVEYRDFIKPSLAEYLRSLGEGEITEGVKFLARLYQERCKQEK
jgi:hypothetical protein